MQRLAPGFLALVLATILSGCALTSTETARQLESQEVVLSGSLYYPGYIALPRVSGQATLGFGAGDVSARVGTAFLMNNVGLGMRIYPSDLINLSLQADLGNVLMDFHAPGYRRYAMLTPRISSSATDDRPFYGGIQSNILYFTAENAYYGEETIFAMAGAFGGIDYPIARRNYGVQAELIFSPLHYDGSDGRSEPYYAWSEFNFNVEISTSMYWRPQLNRQDSERLEPTPEGEDSFNEPEPDPEWNDSGVPLY